MNNEGYGKRTFIPPFLAYVDPVLGETAADNRYVAVVGDDAMPDMHLGRFPVTSLAELAAMVDKTIAYETNPAPGAWRMRAVFVADNPDNAGHFDQLSDVVADHLPPEFVAHKIYLGTTAYPVSQAARAQQATLDAFNQGALLFNYVGHSSISNWAGEFLFGVNTLPQVANGSLYPIMLPMTCLEGSFHNPRFPSLGESVVRLYGRGALASWSPTGLGVASGHDYLHRGFYDAVFNRGVVLLGPATTAGKLNLFVNARFPNGALRFEDLLETYVLFGDPTTRIGLPLAQLSVTGAGPTGPLALGDPVTYTLSYGNFGQVQVQNVALTLTLPGAMTSVAWASSDPTLVRQSSAALSWRLPALAAGASGQITATGRVGWDIGAADLPFSATMSIAGHWPETDYSDNRAGPFTATLLPGDLRIKQVTQAANPTAPGERVTFTLAFLNYGPGASSGISLTLPTPALLDDVQVVQNGAAATLRPGAAYVWDVAPLRSGDFGQIIVSGRIPLALQPQHAFWVVAGQIAAVWTDPDLGNNVAEPGRITVLIPDAYEPDDSPAQAHRVSLPLSNDWRNHLSWTDQDWLVFRPRAGVTYIVRVVSQSEGAETALSLWDADRRLVAKNMDGLAEKGLSQIIWRAPDSRDYHLMITPLAFPSPFSYVLQIVEARRSFLPAVGRPLPGTGKGYVVP